MSATLVKLASSHRLTPVVGFDEKSGFILRFTQADGIKPHALSRHTKDSHFVPRWGECSLSLAFAFSDFSFQLFPCGFTEPTLALGRGQARAPNPLPTRQASARFRPRPMTDSPLSARSTPLHFIFADFNSVPLRSDGRKLPRQSVNVVRVPKIQDSRGRDAPHIGHDQQYGRETSSGQQSNSPRCSARARRGITARGSACRREQSNSPRDFVRARQRQ